jgi:hypothetical protein
VPTRANPVTTTPFVLVPANNVFAADVPGPVAAQIPLRAISVADSFGGRTGAGPLLTGVNAGAGAEQTPAVEVGESSEPPVATATPSIVATLDTVDLSALGRGLERFLGRLERAGEELVGDGEGLRPWLVAGAAAATAAEIARRQLKRAAELAAEADARPEGLFVG